MSSHSPACEKSPDSEIYIDQLHLNTLEWFWRDVKTNNTWEDRSLIWSACMPVYLLYQTLRMCPGALHSQQYSSSCFELTRGVLFFINGSIYISIFAFGIFVLSLVLLIYNLCVRWSGDLV